MLNAKYTYKETANKLGVSEKTIAKVKALQEEMESGK
jgi:predicted transcriptional regulator